jgi:DNA-directed RNA polymerase specialized sigma24 family protein
MQQCTTSGVDRDALLLSLLECVTPVLRCYAGSAQLEFDELYQDASVKILQILESLPQRAPVSSLERYVVTSVKHQVIDKIRYLKVRRAASLDVPQGIDGLLGDVLPSGYSVDPVDVVLALERLEELQYQVNTAKCSRSRRVLQEMYSTAQACVRTDFLTNDQTVKQTSSRKRVEVCNG